MTDGDPPPGGTPPGAGGDIRRAMNDADPKRVGTIGGIVVGALLLLMFVVQNSQTVRVSFLFFEMHLSLIWVIVLSAIIGWGLGVLGTRLVKRRMANPPH